MARLAFILLCHRDPKGVAAQARALSAAGDAVAIHYDAGAEGYDVLEAEVAGETAIALAPRVRCGWGEWSLVQASLNAARTALEAFPEATHLYMVSGDCRPVLSAAEAHARLDADPVDRIECADFFTSGWIRTGPVEERLVYRHLFNERRRKWLFYRSMELQQRLKLERPLPEGLGMRIGSQWWCLRRATVEAVLAFCRDRPEVVRFFRTTWIPDETFFQTLVAHLVPRDEIDDRPPTFLTFTDYGMPATFHDDHYDLLVGQEEFFARKIAPGATRLRARLDALWASGMRDLPRAGDGRRLHGFLTQRGREGRRFGRRAWEEGGQLGVDRNLVVLICRRWWVAKALARAIRARGLMESVGYLFDEDRDEAWLPDLGGLEGSRAKRHRHRRATLRLVFDALGTDRLAICVDPADLGLLWDVHGDRAGLRMLLLDTIPTEEELRARGVANGLISEGADDAAAAEPMAALAREQREETARLREAGLPGLSELSESASEDAIVAALRGVLGCDAEAARDVAREAGLLAVVDG